MVGASLVGTAGGVGLTLIRLAKSLMDAVQWDSGDVEKRGWTAALFAQVLERNKYGFYGSGALVGVGPKVLRE